MNTLPLSQTPGPGPVTGSPLRAFVRPPGASFSNAISRRGLHPDPQLARAQHDEYVRALRQADVQVTLLPPDERYPDSCFVQDTAICAGGLVILTRLAETSRAGEVEEIARQFDPRVPLCRIGAPGTLEGGDVMVLPGRVLVGESERTNADGIAQLAALLAPQRIEVRPVPVGRFLHLLSGATYLGRDTVLAAAEFADRPEFSGLTVIPVPAEEEYAANVLALDGSVIVPAGFPETARRIAAAGLTVIPVPLSEFENADGGATCLSLIY